MFFKKIINSFAWQLGKYIFFALLIILILILKGTGVLALEATTWRTGKSTSRDDVVLTANPSYSYDGYNSDEIRDFIFNIYNQLYYEDSITISEFYKQYTYVIRAYSSTTIRIYMQDYNILMDYQGLTPIEGNDTKFFFYNQFGFYREAPISYYYGAYGVFYNTYIDVNYNTDSYTIYNDTIISSDVYWENLVSMSESETYNFNLLDSYNNNFAFVEQFSSTWQASNPASTISPYPYYHYPTFSYSLPTLPQTTYVATPPPGDDESLGEDENGNDSTLSVDLSETNNLIQNMIDSSIENINNVIDKMNDTKEVIAGGFSDVIDTITSWFSNIFDTITVFFSSFFNDLKQTLIDLFVPKDLSFLNEHIEEWKDKLGFLYEIIVLLEDFFSRLLDSDWETWTSITFPGFEINGILFWEEQEIDITPIVKVVEPYKIYTSLACVILCVNGCIKYYYSFFGGD